MPTLRRSAGTASAPRVRRALLLTLLCAIATHPGQRALAEEPVTLRIMTFNVWYGGEQVSLAKVGEAIRAADADIVGVQEADRNLARIAEAAGLPYVDTRRRLLSRWPIFDSGTGQRTDSGVSPYSTTGLDRDALHAWVMVRPGKVVAVANVHLSNNPSGTGLAKRGAPLADVLAAEAGSRVLEATPLAALGRLAANGTPVFLTGDFNTPSHLDWTEAVQRVRTEIPYAIEWPTTRLLADAGLRDSYREVHADPVTKPGFTWTPGTPHPLQPRDESRERIDYVLAGGRAVTRSSQVVGEAGGPDVDIPITPWPSDHRAVVASFEVVPIDAPPLIAVTPRRVVAGATFLLRTWDPEGEDWTAFIVARGGNPSQAFTGVRAMTHSYQRAVPLSTVGLASGDYDALLVGDDGRVLARNAFTIAMPGAAPEIAPVAGSVRAGTPIKVRWRNAPGDLRDWVGVYAAGDPDVTSYLAFVYTEAAFDGEAVITPEPGDAPLPPGDYELRLLHDESYVVLARARFSIVP